MYDARPAPEPLAKDCPHCQSNDIVLDRHGFLYCAVCFSCNMSGPRRQEREEALAAWNALPRRADIERVELERDWLAEVLARYVEETKDDWIRAAQQISMEGEWARIPEPEESHDAAE